MEKLKTEDSKYVYVYFALLIFVYIYYKSTSITFGDGIGFLYAIEQGFDISTSATTHFLYMNFLKIVNDSIPILDNFRKAIYVSIIFSLLTVTLVYHISYLLSRNMIASITSALLLGLSFTYWRQTEIIEVYTTNCFIVSLLIWAILKKTIEKSTFVNPGLILGISLLIHIQNILLIPFYLFHLYDQKSDKKYIIKGLILFILTSSVLFIIPVYWNTNSIASIFFQNVGFQEKAISIDLLTLLKGFFRSVFYFLYNYMLFVFFIIHGAILLFKKNIKIFVLLFLAGAPIWVFSMKYDVTDNYVFFLTSYMVCCIASSLSFSHFLDKVKMNFRPLVPLLIFVLPIFYYLSYLTLNQIPQVKDFGSSKAYKGGLKYYLWPGMRNNVDMLDVAANYKDFNISEEELKQVDWNFEIARKYNVLIKEKKDSKNPRSERYR